MNDQKNKYDLQDRTYIFSKNVRRFINKIPKRLINMDDCKQLIRSSGSVGANYIEANESLGKKDFMMRIKICRKEAKESIYWLKFINIENVLIEDERTKLIQESTEIMRIFGAILMKFKDK